MLPALSVSDRERLTNVPVTLREGAVTLPPAYASSLDADGFLHVLCVVVTRSGYAWQPVFVSRR